jgi:hypothetical protein
MFKGWISLHRKLQDHWLWQDKPYGKGQAWIDILFLVNYKDNKILMDGQLIDVFRGEHITSEYILSKRWGWSRTKVRNFLSILEKENMIENIKKDKKRTRLKVCNYNSYQLLRTTEELEENYRRTTEELQKNLNNNDNNMLLSIYNKNHQKFQDFYSWKEEQKKDDNSYLEYLQERANFYIETKGKENPETINALYTLKEKG